MNDILQQLDLVFQDFNVDVELAPEYYNSNQINFYRSRLIRACQNFGMAPRGNYLSKQIDWSKLLTDKYTTCDINDSGAICPELTRPDLYVKDNYYPITECLYKNRQLIPGNELNIQQWLVSKSRYRLKPFFMLNLVGVYVEYLNNNRDNFIIALTELEKVDWSKL